MIRVQNRQVIRLLSKRGIRANRQRNYVALFAIMLTGLLFTTLLTIGSSLFSSMQINTMRQVGTSAHAGLKFITQEQYDTLLQDTKIRDVSYNIIIGMAENDALRKEKVEIRWTEEKSARWSFSMPTTGRLPETGMELATSTAVLDALRLPHELGVSIPLEFTVYGKQYKDTFTLCGFWEADGIAPANQAFVSRAYCDKVAPVLTNDWEKEAKALDPLAPGAINPSIFFSSSWNIEEQVETLKERCGFDATVGSGVNWAYATSAVDASSVLMIGGFSLLILLAGYLIIYNIFTISVSQDIRYYGLLKTIGTTGRQLKQLVRRQALLLCIAGIPLGLLSGYICARLLLPAVMQVTILHDQYVVSINPLIFIGSALFTLLTVFVSCIRPCRMAAQVSPIEALRYTGQNTQIRRRKKKSTRVSPFSMAVAGLHRNSRKTILTVVSLSLSLILLNSVFTLIQGFDMNKYLQNQIVTDYCITDSSIYAYANTLTMDGICQDTIETVAQLPGLEGMGNVYMQEIVHHLSDKAAAHTIELLEKNQDVYLSWPDVMAEQTNAISTDHRIDGHIYGIDEYLLPTIQALSAEEQKKFLSGEYVLVSGMFSEDTTDRPQESFYETGDPVTLDFGNGNQKTYTCLAIADLPYALGPMHSHLIDVNFTLPGEEYCKQANPEGALYVAFNIDDAHTSQTDEWIERYCTQVQTNLDYRSRNYYAGEFEGMKMMFAFVGGFLSIILGLIGILNFINTIFTAILTRRHELALLQSVGMTEKQLRSMLVWEGFTYAALTLLLAATLGSIIAYVGVMQVTKGMWYFTYHFTLLPLLGCMPLLIAIAVLIPLFCCKQTTQHSVVERLRESE